MTALQRSIEKWEAIARGELADLGAKNCPLCGMFAAVEDQDGVECAGCPVRERTGLPGCCASPYEDWMDANTSLGRQCRDEGQWVADDPALARLARDELAFLRSLLPLASRASPMPAGCHA